MQRGSGAVLKGLCSESCVNAKQKWCGSELEMEWKWSECKAEVKRKRKWSGSGEEMEWKWCECKAEVVQN